MIIRAEQIHTLEEVRMPEFANFMVEHLKDFTPLHSKSLGETGIRELIRLGAERAKGHGFTFRGPVKFYIETAILLGIDFVTDPQYVKLAKILQNPAIPDQIQRADGAHAWLVEYLQVVGGPKRRLAREALQRARKLSLLTAPVNNFQQHAIQQMRENHPEKAAYLGEGALLALLGRAGEEAKKYAMSTDNGIALFVGLMFAVGHGVAGDPKYPWVMNTLTNSAIAPERRVERLYSKTMTYLDYVLENLGND
ncbi:MAG: hypothetical protein ABI822_00795 [Bryobacteraceae bacterium]